MTLTFNGSTITTKVDGRFPICKQSPKEIQDALAYEEIHGDAEYEVTIEVTTFDWSDNSRTTFGRTIKAKGIKEAWRKSYEAAMNTECFGALADRKLNISRIA